MKTKKTTLLILVFFLVCSSPPASSQVDTNVSVQNLPPIIGSLFLSLDNSQYGQSVEAKPMQRVYFRINVADINGLGDLDVNASYAKIWSRNTSWENDSAGSDHVTASLEDDGSGGSCDDVAPLDGIWCGVFDVSLYSSIMTEWALKAFVCDFQVCSERLFLDQLRVIPLPFSSTPGSSCRYKATLNAPYYLKMYPGEGEQIETRFVNTGCGLSRVSVQLKLGIGQYSVSPQSVSVGSGKGKNFVFDYFLPSDAKPGDYKGSFVVESNRLDFTHPVNLRVLETQAEPSLTTLLSLGECVTNYDCGTDEFCLMDVCQKFECSTDKDCQADEFCSDNLCAALFCSKDLVAFDHGCVNFSTTTPPPTTTFSTSLKTPTTSLTIQPATEQKTPWNVIIGFLFVALIVLWLALRREVEKKEKLKEGPVTLKKEKPT
ncbi:MAG: hypothetical protein ABH950_04770 [Candidatus Altiarchaeota archaeon]